MSLGLFLSQLLVAPHLTYTMKLSVIVAFIALIFFATSCHAQEVTTTFQPTNFTYLWRLSYASTETHDSATEIVHDALVTKLEAIIIEKEVEDKVIVQSIESTGQGASRKLVFDLLDNVAHGFSIRVVRCEPLP